MDSAGYLAAASSTLSFVLTTTRLRPSEVATRDMRLVLIRCLVVLLAFALIGGNAHARLHLTSREQPATHAHHNHEDSGQSGQHDPGRNKGLQCCCDCLGCVSAFNLIPELGSVVPMIFGTTVQFAMQDIILHGRVLLPEPKPPRPLTPS